MKSPRLSVTRDFFVFLFFFFFSFFFSLTFFFAPLLVLLVVRSLFFKLLLAFDRSFFLKPEFFWLSEGWLQYYLSVWVL